MQNTYALIMAGGAGTRLWPLSRMRRPKPALRLVDPERTMFQIAVERLQPLFSPEHIFVIANEELCLLLQGQALDLPAENFIVEPFGRDTAPAIGLAALHIRRRDPDAVIAVVTADHYIADEETFREALAVGCQAAAEDDLIITLGIAPSYPETGFGYIERGDRVHKVDSTEIFTVDRFIEKPSGLQAREFVASDRYSWNSGMFIWRAARLMREFATHAPELYRYFGKIEEALGSDDYTPVLNETWARLKGDSVDKALMEKIEEGVCVIPVEIGWQDIGNFKTLYNILDIQTEDTDNVSVGRRTPLVLESARTLIYSDRLVAVLGVEDMVIVDTDDILLVCRLDRAQDVKRLVEQLKAENLEEYL